MNKKMKNLVVLSGLAVMIGALSGCGGGTTVQTDTATVKQGTTGTTSVTTDDASVNVDDDEVHVTGGGASVDVNADGSVNIEY